MKKQKYYGQISKYYYALVSVTLAVSLLLKDEQLVLTIVSTNSLSILVAASIYTEGYFSNELRHDYLPLDLVYIILFTPFIQLGYLIYLNVLICTIV
jgi:hypothetical protein